MMGGENDPEVGRQLFAGDPSGLPGSSHLCMTGDQFVTIGRAVYGDQWKSALGRRLKLSRLWVRQMASGSVIIPETTALAMLALRSFEDLR